MQSIYRMGIKFQGVFNFTDFVGDFCSRKLIPRKYSLLMHIMCTQCMCTCKNAKFNPLEIQKLRTFYKNTKFYILEILYPYSICSMSTLMYTLGSATGQTNNDIANSAGKYIVYVVCLHLCIL